MSRDPWESYDRELRNPNLAKMRQGLKAADAAARRELRDILCFVAGGFFVAVVILGLEVVGK